MTGNDRVEWQCRPGLHEPVDAGLQPARLIVQSGRAKADGPGRMPKSKMLTWSWCSHGWCCRLDAPHHISSVRARAKYNDGV
jgi:hypothetical protein